MYTVISTLIIIICVLLVIVVLVQNSKGGGLAQNFAAQQQIMGVRKTTDFLEKATWTLAAAIMVLSFVSVGFISSTRVSASSELDEMLRNQQTQTETPGFATPQADDEAAEVEAPAEAE